MRKVSTTTIAEILVGLELLPTAVSISRLCYERSLIHFGDILKVTYCITVETR